jgi:hypothetical protein
MANVTTTTAAVFIPEIWAQRALDYVRANITLAKLVTKDSDVAAFQKGDVLHIPYPGTFTAAQKSADTAITPVAPSGDGEVTVTLNQHWHVTFLVEDIVRAQSNFELMDLYVRGAAIALAEKIEGALFALYSGLSQSVGTSGTDLTEDVVLEAKKELDDAKIARAGRFMIVSSKDENALLKLDRFTRADAIARGATPIAEGQLGRLHGFDTYMSQLVPVVAGSPNSTKNFAGTKEAYILAMRGLPEPPPNSGARAATIQDPESGLVIRTLYAYNPSHLGVQVTLDVLYGLAELRDAAGVVVLS